MQTTRSDGNLDLWVRHMLSHTKYSSHLDFGWSRSGRRRCTLCNGHCWGLRSCLSLRSTKINNGSGPRLGKFLDLRRAPGTMILDAQREFGEPRQISLDFCRLHNTRGCDIVPGNLPQKLFGGDLVLEIDRVCASSPALCGSCAYCLGPRGILSQDLGGIPECNHGVPNFKE
jgi:hypothetical protein